MQRYRTITIHCENENTAIKMLDSIVNACNKPPFVYEKDAARFQYEKTIRIISTHPNTTEAVIVVYVTGSDVKVGNVVPYKKSVFRIEKNEFNTIIAAFKNEVIDKIVSEDRVDFPACDYSIESLIPKSFQQLNCWVNSPGAPNEPFTHPCDLNHWFDFVIALVLNDERKNLSSGDLGQWLEEQKWEEETIEETVQHYEHDTNLLDYYYSNKNNV